MALSYGAHGFAKWKSKYFLDLREIDLFASFTKPKRLDQLDRRRFNHCGFVWGVPRSPKRKGTLNRCKRWAISRNQPLPNLLVPGCELEIDGLPVPTTGQTFPVKADFLKA